MSRIVITGGPGAGKTTLLLALQARGYTIVGDSARAIIQDRMSRGLSPRPDADDSQFQVLRRLAGLQRRAARALPAETNDGAAGESLGQQRPQSGREVHCTTLV